MYVKSSDNFTKIVHPGPALLSADAGLLRSNRQGRTQAGSAAGARGDVR